MRKLIKQIIHGFSAAKTFPYVLEGLRFRNNRTRIECVDLVGFLIDNHGAEIVGQLKSLQLVASLTAEQDGEIRKAALNTLATGEDGKTKTQSSAVPVGEINGALDKVMGVIVLQVLQEIWFLSDRVTPSLLVVLSMNRLFITSKYDIYSKSKVRIDVEKVKPYYLSLIEKVNTTLVRKLGV
ncbi:Protein MOR1 [Camellia lanceoleosa]|uniref:Protein MOR1 n=1 Tax=Camellia lanceoleosa TaxID=1840588 RepID=A0ACC0HZS9_9ERIC|nr:Protein MOR1 [Camellia lanceoleosa]